MVESGEDSLPGSQKATSRCTPSEWGKGTPMSLPLLMRSLIPLGELHPHDFI